MSSLSFSDAPGFDIYADRGPHLVRVCSVMIALSAIAVALRFGSRRLSKVRLCWDDCLILIALPLAWTPSILMIYSVQHFNFGKHLQWATASDIRHFWIYLYASEIIYPISVVLIKCSILFLLYRLFHVRQFKIYASTIGVSVIFWGITTLVVAVFNCNPIDAYWDTQITNKVCVNTLHYFLGIQIPNIILDVVIMILPLPYLWRSHITLSSQKVGILFVFILGGFVIIAATLRLITIAVHQRSADFTYDLIDLGVWTALETNTGIICACFATMQPLLEFGIFGILDTERSTPNTAGRIARPSPEPEFTDRQNRFSLNQWPRHNTAPFALEYGGLRPIRNVFRRGRHTASSSWGFNQPLPPDFLDEPLPTGPEAIQNFLRKGYQTRRSSFGANQPVPHEILDEPLRVHDESREAEYHTYDMERAETGRPRKNKVAGISRFNAFSDVDNIAREERSRRMRKKMEGAGWPMTGERRTWI